MDVLSQDLRVALRRIQRAPALATAIVLTIGLGLGAAAAIFTTSDAALVEPLPYADPERLVHLWEVRAGTAERSPTSYPTLLDWRSRAKSFSALEAYDPTNSTVGVGDEARMLRGAQVTAGFLRLLGVRISAGRDFLQNEDATTGAGVAIVSERFARSLAGRSALDRTIGCGHFRASRGRRATARRPVAALDPRHRPAPGPRATVSRPSRAFGRDV